MNFNLTCDLEQVLVVTEITANDRPLVHKLVLDLGVASVQVEEVKRVSLFALFLNEGLGVENLVELTIQLVSIRLELICLSSTMLVDVIECAEENLVYFFSDMLGVLFDLTHLCHDHLELLLDDVLFLCQRDIFSHGISTGVCVCIFNPQDLFITRVTDSRLHIAHYDTLGAKWLTDVCIEELKSLLMRSAFSEREWFVTRWYTHMALQNAGLMEVAVVVKAEVSFVVNAIELGGSGLLCCRARIVVRRIGCRFITTDTKVGLALLADWHVGVDGVRYAHLSCHFVH